MISKNQLKQLSLLKQKKHRERHGKFLVEGLRLCEELLTSNLVVEQVLVCVSYLTSARGEIFLQHCRARNIPLREVDAATFDKISDTVSSQGLIAIVRIRQDDPWKFVAADSCKALVAMWRLNDPGNLGTIIRSAAWFGFDAVLTSRGSVASTNPKVVRATMGALFHIPVFEGLDFAEMLRRLPDLGYKVLHADPQGETEISRIPACDRTVLLLGGETAPLPRQLSDKAITLRIPRYGFGESLNVASAAAIIMSTLKRGEVSN